MKKTLNIILVFLLSAVLTSANLQAQDTLQLSRLHQQYEEGNDSVKLNIIFSIIFSTELEDVDTAIYLSKKALELATKANDSLDMAYAMQSIAIYSNIQSNHLQALEYDLEALRIIKKYNEPSIEANFLNNLGEDYFYLDLFSEAFEYYRQSLEKSKEVDDGITEAIATYNMGRVLKSMGQYDRAKEYIEASMNLSDKNNDRAGIAYSKHDLAQILILEKNYDAALNQLNDAYILSDSIREDILTPEILGRIASVYDLKSDYKNAQIYYDQALEFYRSQDNKSGIGEIYYGKGNVNLHKGDEQQAKYFYEKCQLIADEIQDNELIINCYKALSVLYENENDFKKALNFYRKFKDLEDSIFSEKKKEQFAQIQIKYETAKKDIEIELLNQKEGIQLSKLKNEEFIRNILVVILAFLGVLLYSLYKNGEKRRKINEILVEQQKEIKSKSKELTSLVEMKDKFFSIVSHDLRSPINALVGILDILDDGNLTQKELQDVSRSLKVRLDHTRKLLDTLLDWAMLQMNEIKIHTEEIVLNTIVKENLHFFEELGDKKINFINHVNEKDLVVADRNMLDLIIRNLLSNCIKFTDEGGTVEVLSEMGPKKTLIVMIKDDGIGMSSEQMEKLFDTNELYTTRGTANEKGTGLGLRLCKEFVERMGGNIWVESKEGEGSTFKFTVNRA